MMCTPQSPGPDPSAIAFDVFGALGYLRSLPFVDRERIGVMGWYYGAMAALVTTRQLLAHVVQPRAGGFRAPVAFYPGCSSLAADTAIPVLLLLGQADDWTPPQRCVQVAEQLQQRGRTVVWKVYPGAYHAFDVVGPSRDVLGHQLEYDPTATADAIERVKDFLAEQLR